MLGHEAREQIAIFEWAKLALSKHPELEMLLAIPNGGYRHKIEAVNLKRQGVRAGVPDMLLAIPKNQYAGLWIELKVGTNKVSKSQKEWIKKLNDVGYLAIVCYGFDEARNKILEYIRME